MSDCEHGFVVRAAEGTNRYWCKECDERFSNYPINERKAAAREAYEQEALKKEALTLQQGARALANLLYPAKKK